MDAAFARRIKQSIEFEQNRKEPPEGFPSLPVIPGGRYTAPEFLELERRYLWQRAWLYACHTDQLPEPGSFVLFEKTGSPILLSKGKDQQIRAFYNTCRHRGGPLVTEASGQVEGRFVCGYHGWTYDLTGKLVGLRDRRDFVDLDLDCKGLVPVRCERLGNWVFINEDPDAEPLLQHLGPIPAQMEQFDLENLRLVEHYGVDVECNVKVMMDAFLEVYHLKSIHQGTVDRFLDHRASSIVMWSKGHSVMITPNRRPDWVDPATKGMKKIATVTEIPRVNNVSYNLYPNLVTPVADTGMPFLTFWPTGPRTTRVECAWFAPDWGGGERHSLWKTRIGNFHRILEEDTRFAPQIQDSIESPGFRGMTLNYQERRIYHWHEEMDRRIGIRRIPPELRVQPAIGDWVDSG